ncbi:MAG: hypothetical protein ACKVH8_12260 [Pirellulales bacterium]
MILVDEPLGPHVFIPKGICALPRHGIVLPIPSTNVVLGNTLVNETRSIHFAGWVVSEQEVLFLLGRIIKLFEQNEFPLSRPLTLRGGIGLFASYFIGQNRIPSADETLKHL